MKLSDLQVGETGKIKQISTSDVNYRRLLEMGFTEGTQVEVVKSAPLADPIQYQIRGYEITLRRKDAMCIEVEKE